MRTTGGRSPVETLGASRPIRESWIASLPTFVARATATTRTVSSMPRAAFCSGVASCGRTKRRLRDLGRTALSTFREASLLLDLSHADTSRLDGVRYMNAGWTKVYALMLDGFPIYDGRVGAAMGYLVQRYCVSVRLCQVPTRLRFRWGVARGRHNRNPSTRSLWFPGLTATNPRTWGGV